MPLFAATLGIIVGLAVLPQLLFMGLLTLGAWRRRSFRFAAAPEQADFVFVIPGHNEESGIAATIASCLATAWPTEKRKVLVIADNCTDATAAVAKRAGAEVWERADAVRKSKGYALEDYFALALAGHFGPLPKAYVIVDADTRVAPNLLEVFNRALFHGIDWLQCTYGVSNPEASWRTRLMTYALALFNGVWLAGQDALGMGAALRGNGMCLATSALQRFPWKAAALAEDLEFSWRLRLAGERVAFTAETEVKGEMVARGGKASRTQRQRWEVGRAELRQTFGDAINQARNLTLRQKWLWKIDLNSWPLSRVAFLAGLTVVAALLSGNPLVWGLATLEAMILGAYLLSPFMVVALPLHYGGALLFAPLYLLWKVGLLFLKKPTGWVRTERENSADSSEKKAKP